jgi:putative effector of murein hydrolase LrgA (UPF0299 family)
MYHLFFLRMQTRLVQVEHLDKPGFTVLVSLSWVLIPVLSVVIRSYPVPSRPAHPMFIICVICHAHDP